MKQPPYQKAVIRRGGRGWAFETDEITLRARSHGGPQGKEPCNCCKIGLSKACKDCEDDIAAAPCAQRAAARSRPIGAGTQTHCRVAAGMADCSPARPSEFGLISITL